MNVKVKEPTSIETYFDKDGRLTQAGLIFFQQIVRAIKELQP